METITVKVPLQQLHLEHALWKNEFSFYADELKVLNRFLEQVAEKNTGLEPTRGIEHFQNQFIRQKEVLDEIVHEIGVKENELLIEISQMNRIQVDKSKVTDHVNMREKVETYRKIYAELKEEFMRFVAKWI